MFRFHKAMHEVDDAQPILLAECEAFLHGEYLDLLVERGSDVPAWVWVNALAHGETDQVLDLASSRKIPRSDLPPEYRAWRIVTAAIASDVLSAIDETGIALRDIQDLVLVPIEFAVMVSPVGPRTTLQCFERALRERTS